VHHHTFQINQPTRCNNFSSSSWRLWTANYVSGVLTPEICCHARNMLSRPEHV